jgi:hypothetical protein
VEPSDDRSAPTGDELLRVLGTLANPQRLRIVAVLARDGRKYVSQLSADEFDFVLLML